LLLFVRRILQRFIQQELVLFSLDQDVSFVTTSHAQADRKREILGFEFQDLHINLSSLDPSAVPEVQSCELLEL